MNELADERTILATVGEAAGPDSRGVERDGSHVTHAAPAWRDAVPGARRRRRSSRPRSTSRRSEGDADAEHRLAASAVAGREPPAGPQWMRGLAPVRPAALAYDKALCASLDGFTLHAATRAGALDAEGREALLRYVLRPPIAQERVELRPDGLVRIALKRAYSDGTVAVDMDPLSLLSRLAAAVPPPRFHTVKYAGVLASASPWRARIAPPPKPPPKPLDAADACGEAAAPTRRPNGKGRYWPWANLLRRTFAIDVLECPSCKGRMKLVAMVTDAQNIARYLTALGEPTTVPERSPSRGPPFWSSTVLRRKALGHVA